MRLQVLFGPALLLLCGCFPGVHVDPTISKSTACPCVCAAPVWLDGGRVELCAISVTRPVNVCRGNASICTAALRPRCFVIHSGVTIAVFHAPTSTTDQFSVMGFTSG